MGKHYTGTRVRRTRFGGSHRRRRFRSYNRSYGSRYYGKRRYGSSSSGNGVFWIVLIVICFVLIVCGPPAMIIWGTIKLSNSFVRQKFIDDFNSQTKTWEHSKDLFSEKIESIKVSYYDTLHEPAEWKEIDSTIKKQSDVNYDRISKWNDNPPISKWNAFYFNTKISFGDVNFDNNKVIKWKFTVHFNDGSTNIQEYTTNKLYYNAFKKVTRDCNCEEDCYWVGFTEYCDQYCDTCYVRSSISTLCFIIDERNIYENPNSCYYGSDSSSYSFHSSTTKEEDPIIKDMITNFEIRHKQDPEVILNEITLGTNDFGEDNNDDYDSGITFIVIGSIFVIAVVLFAMIVSCLFIYRKMKRNNTLKRLIKNPLYKPVSIKKIHVPSESITINSPMSPKIGSKQMIVPPEIQITKPLLSDNMLIQDKTVRNMGDKTINSNPNDVKMYQEYGTENVKKDNVTESEGMISYQQNMQNGNSNYPPEVLAPEYKIDNIY